MSFPITVFVGAYVLVSSSDIFNLATEFMSYIPNCVMTLLVIAIGTECVQCCFSVHIYNQELPLGTYIVLVYILFVQ